ncbi:serpin B9 [Tetranychus urticae]|uniref:Serpin domain-containing protein n=1 Tax=Tetranychus urticae TaxID=32264 RepID=T1KRF0_TETUR|nr:serpin B9 [Tetranychus urticae]
MNLFTLPLTLIYLICFLVQFGLTQNSFNSTSSLALPINQFSLSFYRSVHNLSENVFFSPLSISMMYSMLLRGASGLTAQQIINTFQYPLSFKTSDEIHAAFKELVFDYKMIEIRSWQRNFTLKLGNLVLVDKAFPILADYADHLLNEYHASVAEEDFTAEGYQIMNKVNKWVASKTNNKMVKLFNQPFDYLTKLLLINVIYFEGNWKLPFDRSLTAARTFYNYDGSLGDVQMMSTTGSYRYAEFWHVNMKMLELPFQGDISLILILPVELTHQPGLTKFLNSLTTDQLNSMISSLTQQTVELSLPKFRLEGRYDLNKILPDMGLFLPFITNTDFFTISPSEGLKVTDSMHTSLIQISEEGSQHQTSGSVGSYKLPILARSRGPRFIVNHPFGFIIRDNAYGINLFLGVINKL